MNADHVTFFGVHATYRHWGTSRAYQDWEVARNGPCSNPDCDGEDRFGHRCQHEHYPNPQRLALSIPRERMQTSGLDESKVLHLMTVPSAKHFVFTGPLIGGVQLDFVGIIDAAYLERQFTIMQNDAQ